MFKFEHPEFLTLLAAVPLLAGLVFYYFRWRAKSIALFGQPALVERLTLGFSQRRNWLKISLFGLALALLAIGLANPQLSNKKEKVKQKSADIFLVLDISESMLAEDIAPSRLERARVFAEKLIRALPGQRIGLVFFAGSAFLQMPLSTDAGAAVSFLRQASPELISEQGTAIGEALELAGDSFDKDVAAGRAVILITDGENHDDAALGRAEILRKLGITVWAVGVGTAEGAPIPIGVGVNGTVWKKDKDGGVVSTKLNETMLAELADAGGGDAYNLSQGDGVLEALRSALDRLEKREVEARSFTEFESYFQWFLLPALLLLVLEFWLAYRVQR